MSRVDQGGRTVADVLVVDNNPVLLRAVSKILEQEGCFVRTAETGLEALEILEEYEPQIIFTDLVMPLVSGEQLCKILRNTPRHKDVFIVVLSAIFLEDQDRILKDVPCDLCIAKGSLSEIRGYVQHALQKYSSGATDRQTQQAVDSSVPNGLRPSEVTGELLFAQKHLSSILKNLDEGIVELSDHGKIVRMNDAALEIFQAREEELTGKYFTEAIAFGEHETVVEEWLQSQLLERNGASIEIREQNPLRFGTSVVTGICMVVMENDLCYGLCIFRDITRQYQAEKESKRFDEAFRFAKKMDALSCMAGGVAHDFNNLLTIICGNLDMFLHYQADKSKEELLDLVEQTRKAALVAVDLTRQISCFSHFGIMSREDVNIGAFVEKTAREFLQPHGTHLEYKKACGECLVSADPGELKQVLENILQNSIEAASGAGTVEILVENEVIDSPVLRRGRYISAGKYVRIDIQDHSGGIEQSEMYRIFDPYYSTKERGAIKGMGLGLAVVYSILKNHGGYVIVESEVGVGTTVSLFLPVKVSGIVEKKGREHSEKVGKRILLVDSDKQMQEIGKIMLSHLGHDTVCVSGVSKIYDLHEEYGSWTPDLIVVDISDESRESMSEFCIEMQERFPGVRLIAVSGTTLDPVMENCKECGFINGLQKPYTLDNLANVIASSL